MDDSSHGPSVAIGIAARAVAIAALAYLVLQLTLNRHLYATALVLVGLMALLTASLVQRIGRSTWSRSRSFDPSLTPASQRVSRLEDAWQQQLDYRQTLLDTVAAALFVVDEAGRATPVNRAAQRLAGRDIYRLEDVQMIGASAARSLLALPAGTRRIVTLAGGQQSFASVALFSAPGQSPRRLIGLQRIAGELDAVEVKAWQDVSRVLAHEMMNSLTPIASLSESLERLLGAPAQGGNANARDQEISGALEAIRRRSQGLMQFVEHYRQVAQVPTPQPCEVNLADLLCGIERLMAGALREQRVRYRREISPPELTCWADAYLIEQVLLNLLRNAIDAHAAAGVADTEPYIEVLCRARDGQVEIAVIDNGPGLRAGSEDQIFVPFFTTKSSGSGIGLSVARQIVLAHAGRLEVQAHSPRGSAFVLTLPAFFGREPRSC
ncbi:MAG TPA: ATP-binding protein [Steroidobacteraceae bacterium]|nr:ATP-binding protein [Steroidobacteraceae bacterium]